MSFATTNPYTGEVLKTFPTATDDEVTAAIGRADQAFASWRNASFAERARVMQSAADILRRDVEHYAPILTLEMGKLLAEALKSNPTLTQLDLRGNRLGVNSGRAMVEALKVNPHAPLLLAVLRCRW